MITYYWIIKTNITHFIVDIIVILFNKYNLEVARFNSNLNFFNQILYTTEFYLETQNKDMFVDAIDYYSNEHTLEQVDAMTDEQREQVIDEMENDIEEADALDCDELFNGENLFDGEGRLDLYGNYNFIENIENMKSEHILPNSLQ